MHFHFSWLVTIYSSSIINLLFTEIAKYGAAFAKRAYGDWSGPTLKGWKDKLLEQSIQQIQQFAYTHGKNVTDSAMTIDTINRYDGFCLVSSDSDFTRLAARVRESGLPVYELGERKTPQPFVAACDKFNYTENLVHVEESVPHTNETISSGKQSPAKQAQNIRHIDSQLRTTVDWICEIT